MQSGLLKTYQNSISSRGGAAYLLALVLFAFYIIIYFTNWLDPVAVSLGLSSRWTIYGILYTLFVVVGGLFFLAKHGNSRYQRYRTYSVMLVQTLFAFSIPLIMELFNTPGFILTLYWPLKIDYLYPEYILNYPLPIMLYAFLSSLVFVPVMTFFFGKRWYCSWVCGCGGLAETAGDSFRHLSNKSSKAWKFEQYSIYSILIFAIVTTVLVIVNWTLGHKDASGDVVAMYPMFSAIVFKIQGLYGFVVVALLSGVLGVGLYPLLGSRVWCRFFCPLAALMGLIQKFGRFRITVKDDMCISCGNCSTYCEMGIDVRLYAQSNRDIKRASCVGCGICAHVCPRGVLRLENKWDLGPEAEQSNDSVFDL